MRKYILLLCMVQAIGLTAADTAEVLVAAAPGAAFLQGEALEFTLKQPVVPPVEWTLRNWRNEVLRRESSNGGKLLLPPLPNGYYRLELSGFTGSRSFAVVPDPGNRPADPDLFFAMDSAQSWLARPDNNPRRPENAFEVVSEVARRSGVQMVRDRMSWAETNPAPGRYEWTYYKTNAELLAKRGIALSGMYHDAPDWTRRNTCLPVDLTATYAFAKSAAEAFRGQMTNWEFWNEQDHGFGIESAWDYAAAFKAASLGFRAGNPEATVAVGGFAITPLLPYTDTVMKNGASEYFDIFNVHTYRPLRDFSEILKDIRAHMKRHGMEGRPIWFTETGSGMEGAGSLESFLPGIKMHSPDQELLIAEYLQKMMITMQMLGVDRDFFFVLPPYSEYGGNKDWGLMRRDYTVKPGFAAFATLVDKLGGAEPEGEIEPGEGIKGYLYRHPNGSRTLVYWSVSELDTEPVRPGLSAANRHERTFRLPQQPSPLHGTDMLGTPFTVNGTPIIATRFPAFLDDVGKLAVKTPAIAPATRKSEENATDRTIVYRTDLSSGFRLSAGKDYVDVGEDGAAFNLQVWNLSDRPKEGVITVSGGNCTGIPEKIIIPPFGKTELELTFMPVFDDDFKTELRIDGSFNGRKTTPLVIPVQGLQAMTGAGQKLEITAMHDSANWRRNASGEMEITYDEAEQAVRFHTRFPPIEDRWVYPEYTLQLPQESLKGALGIVFEMKVSDVSAVRQMLLMAVTGEDERDLHLRINAPSEEWTEHSVQFPEGFEPEKVKLLRIGLNSLASDITFLIRNVRFLYRP